MIYELYGRGPSVASGVLWLAKPSVPWRASSVGHLLCPPESIQPCVNPAPSRSQSERMCGQIIHVGDERGEIVMHRIMDTYERAAGMIKCGHAI